MGTNREPDDSITLPLDRLESDALASAIIQQVRIGHPTLLDLATS